MKTKIRLIIAALVLLAFNICTTTVQAEDYTYSTNNGAISITRYTGSGGAVIIPDTINGLPVTSVGQSTFENCTSLTNVTIPNSVIGLGDFAFRGCRSLASVTIPNSVRSMGEGTFIWCTSLSAITMPKGVTNIGANMFALCTSLTSVTIPDSVTSIGEGAFENCTSLTGVTIPDSVFNIANWVFGRCTNLTSLVIPNGVTNIGNFVFYDCPSLTGVTVGSENPVYSSVDGVLFNKGQTTLIQCPGGKAGSYTVPSTVGSIAYWAFGNCTHLTSVTIPSSVTHIGDQTFYNCPRLMAINVDAINSAYSSVDGVLFNKSRTTLIQFPGGKAGGYVIPNSVTWIGHHAFDNCIGLTNVTIPASVTSIGSHAFTHASLATITIPASVTHIGEYACMGCTSLTSVMIHDGVTSIGDGAFSSCTSLTSITIPNTVTSIWGYAFAECTNLTGIYFQGNAPSLGREVFWGGYNATVYYLPGTTGWGTTFGGLPVILWNPPVPYIYTTDHSTIVITKYTGSGGAVNIPGVLDGLPITGIAERAFYGCASLTSVTIPDSVTSIGDRAFSECNSLTGVYFQGDPPILGLEVFGGDHNATVYYLAGSAGWSSTFGGLLTVLWDSQVPYTYTTTNNLVYIAKYTGPGGVVNIPSTIDGLPVAGISERAFYGCTSLTSVTIPDSVTSIGESAFSKCNLLRAITVDVFNSSYTTLDGVLFDKGQTTLIQYPEGKPSGYTIPDSVTSIGHDAFAGCHSLTSVTVGKNVDSIADGAFAECTNLTGVYFQGDAPDLGVEVFGSDYEATVYYLPGTAGWDTTFGGLPTVLSDQQLPYTYTTASNTITITKYTGPGGVVNIPSTIDGLPVTNLGERVFSGCSSLTSVKIPDSVTGIGDSAFSDCSRLTGVTLGNSATSIGEWAFAYCASLTDVTIPNSVTNIGKYAFFHCASLTAITVDALNSIYSSLDGVLLDKNQTTLIQCPGGKAGSYIVPNSVTNIGSESFQWCISLTSVTIPDSVTSIGDRAFALCANLKSVTLSSRITSIGNYVFGLCTNLANVTIPNNVTNIGSEAFLSCYGLRGVYFQGNAPTVSTNALKDSKRATVYYLPGATGWGATFADCPTVLWNPQVQTSSADFGVRSNQFGFTISGTSGMTVGVEAATSLADPSWVPLETHTFEGDSWYFSDADWANYPSRFYRIRSP